MMFLYKTRLKMDQKDHKTDPKGQKMLENRQKIEFSDSKTCFLVEFSLAEIGGSPLPP